MARREPYVVSVIRFLADLEAQDTLSDDETYRLNGYRRWLAEHYPEVAAALVREYLSMASSASR